MEDDESKRFNDCVLVLGCILRVAPRDLHHVISLQLVNHLLSAILISGRRWDILDREEDGQLQALWWSDSPVHDWRVWPAKGYCRSPGHMIMVSWRWCFLGWFASPMAWDEWWQSVASFRYLSKTSYPHRSHCQASRGLMANSIFGLPGLGAQDDYDFTNQQGSSDWSNLEGWWVHWHGPLLGVNLWTNLDRSSKGYPVAFGLGRNMMDFDVFELANMRKGSSYLCTKCSI